ncbi:MAG: DUF1648 domain-containing protein [Candidatus Altiarchaeota archaeon]|nr:DUF1648 domain-containing protein [Candidatus Altiarchaeota archaeon]
MKIKLIHLMIALGFLVSILAYPKLPDTLATHWNAKGEVNGYSSKTFGLFLMPIMAIFMYALMRIIPKLDPLKKNLKKFETQYHKFIEQIIAFLLYVHVLTLAYNMGFLIDVTRLIIPALAVLFWQVSDLLKHSEQTWFIGIRTPWTLSSKKVWKKTHELGAKLFKYMAVFTLIFVIFPEKMLWFVVMILTLTLYLLYYSYQEYAKENKK